MRNYVPDRGDIVWMDMNPRVGHEQAGRRPALVLSPGAYNGKTRLALLCPITSRVKGYPFEVAIPDGYDISGVILSDHEKSLDWHARKAAFVCKLADEVVEEVSAKLGFLLPKNR